MSKPITIREMKIEHSTSGALPTKIRLFYSDNTKDELLCSFNATQEERIKLVANHLLDVNSPTYHHTLAKGHLQALAKFKRAVNMHRRYSLHRERDLNGTPYELTKNESANLTFLRYFGLLVHDDEAGAGYWILTHRGSEFLKGNLVIEKYVIVKNNTVQGHEGPLVTVDEVWADAPHWPSRDELFVEQPAPREAVQASFAI